MKKANNIEPDQLEEDYKEANEEVDEAFDITTFDGLDEDNSETD